MKYKKNVTSFIVSITFSVLSTYVYALPAPYNAGGETVNGAFGYKFGDVIQKQKEVQITEWSFQPKLKSKHFKDYFLITTPVSKKIMGIIGLSDYTTKKECRKKSNHILKLLKLKYSYYRANEVPQDQLMIDKSIRHRYYSNFYVFYKELINPGGGTIEVSCVLQSSFQATKPTNCKNYGHPYNNSLIDTYLMNVIIDKSHVYSAYKSRSRKSSGFKSGVAMGYVYPYDFGDNVYWPAPNRVFANTYTNHCSKIMENRYKVLINYRDGSLSPEKELEEFYKNKKLQSDDASGL